MILGLERMANNGTEITRWMLDTRELWQGDRIQDTAADLLAIVSDTERTNILRKYHLLDAKMSLGSAMIKRAYIAKCTGLPWSEITFKRKGHPIHGKPCWNPPRYQTAGKPWPTIDFNVSHQAGLVTLVGACTQASSPASTENEGFGNTFTGPLQEITEEVSVGCDITAPNERGDIETVRSMDLDIYTNTFESIFSHEEIYDITYTLPSRALTLPSGHTVSSEQLGRLDRIITCDQDISVRRDDDIIEEFSSDMLVDAKLRRFYTFFALKEAYIKLVGEGLLADWIRDAEFRNVRAPEPGQPQRCSTIGAWGGCVAGGLPNLVIEDFDDVKTVISSDSTRDSGYFSGQQTPNFLVQNPYAVDFQHFTAGSLVNSSLTSYPPSTFLGVANPILNRTVPNTTTQLPASQHDVPEEQLELWLHGDKVTDVRMEVQSFEEEFLLATMVKPASVLGRDGALPDWEILSLDRDVVFWANANSMRQEGWRVNV